VLVFGWLARAVLRNQTPWFDPVIRQLVHHNSSPALTGAMCYVTKAGEPVILVPLMILVVWWLVRSRCHGAALRLVIVWFGGTAIAEILSLVFRRVRPEAFFGYSEPVTYSFPSGHTISSACFYGAVAAILSVSIRSRIGSVAVWTAASAIALLVGYSRVYFGVHYPSDVLASYAVAVVWVVVIRAHRKPSQRLLTVR
jgi:undecaprenyl-diphosphatase